MPIPYSNLCGKADKLEGLVLEPTAHDVGERAKGVLVEWCCVLGLVLEQDHQQSYHECQNSVHKHQELWVLEELARGGGCFAVLVSHDALLKHSPGQVGCLKAKEAHKEDSDSLSHRLLFHLFLGTERGSTPFFHGAAGFFLVAKDTQHQHVGHASWTWNTTRVACVTLTSILSGESLYDELSLWLSKCVRHRTQKKGVRYERERSQLVKVSS